MTKILIKNIEVQNPFVDSYISDILICDGKISKISKEITADVDKIIDGTNKILTRGLIDRHTHGGFGCNFNTCNEDELQNYLINCQKHGITEVLPTIMTDSIENINKQISLIKSVNSKGAKILGIHLEGPFINPNKKGIHSAEYILEPTIENLNKIDTDFIKVLTYAPELDKNCEFLKELLKRNIIPSIGHTECTFDEAELAFNIGAKQLTHMFNAMRSIHHREPSIITYALSNNDVMVEIIADLEHVHKAVIEMVLRLKDKKNIMLISDALPISYSDTKECIFGGEKIFYNGKKATSSDGVLAGSTIYFDDIYERIKDFVKFKDFIGFASENIAKSLNLNNYKNIEVDSVGKFLIWNKNYKIEKVL